MEEKFKMLDIRFPNAGFIISCFDDVLEIEDKILHHNIENIIVRDTFYIGEQKHEDYYIVKGKDHNIYFRDVIDCLIENTFYRKDTDHQFLEDITLISTPKLNRPSIPVYGLSWGS